MARTTCLERSEGLHMHQLKYAYEEGEGIDQRHYFCKLLFEIRTKNLDASAKFSHVWGPTPAKNPLIYP